MCSLLSIGVRAPLDLGGGDLIARKQIHNARKHVLYKRTQVAVKTKTLPFLTSNERIIIPKLQLNPNFLNLRGKRKLVRKMGYFEKSLQCPTEERETTFGSSYQFSVETSHTLRPRSIT